VLQQLYLVEDATRLTDVGLENLKGLSGLQRLDLSSWRVTETGLEHLRGLTSLQTLNLINTRLTDTEVAKLKQALPNCNIQMD
jgi:Leucine-rich repeat (LRR) protein